MGCSTSSFNGGGEVSGSSGGRGELGDGKQKSLNVTPPPISESESGDISSSMQDPSPNNANIKGGPSQGHE